MGVRIPPRPPRFKIHEKPTTNAGNRIAMNEFPWRPPVAYLCAAIPTVFMVRDSDIRARALWFLVTTLGIIVSMALMQDDGAKRKK